MAQSISLLVNNAAELQALYDTSIVDYTRARVLSYMDDFDLVKSSNAPVIPHLIISTASGRGRWIRRNSPSSKWRAQSEWGIDPVSGNDENSGGFLSPLKSTAELQRRIGMYGNVPLGTVIRVLSDFAHNDSFRLFATVAEGAANLVSLAIEGTRRDVANGALLTYTPLSRIGLGSRNTITTATTINWSQHVDKYVLLTSGAGNGYGAFVVTGSPGNATLTPWCQEINSNTAQPTTIPVLQPAGIAPGDTFTIQDPISLGGTPCIRLQGGGHRSISSGRTGVTSVIFRALKNTAHSETGFVPNPGIFEVPTGCRGWWLGCDFQCSISANGYVFGSILGGGTQSVNIPFAVRCYAGGTRARAPLQAGFSIIGASFFFDGDFGFTFPLFVGLGSTATENYPGIVRLGSVYFDTLADSIQIGQAACVLVKVGDMGVSAVYGKAAARGVRVYSGGKLFYDVKPTINVGLGANRETMIGGTDTPWSAVPFVNTTNLAVVAVSA